MTNCPDCKINMTDAALCERCDELEAQDREIERLRDQLAEITGGDGMYYIPQERAMAPGCAGKWPHIIPHPDTAVGRLVKRTIVQEATPA